VRPKDYYEATECVREAGEQLIVRLLCPELKLSATELKQFKDFVATSGFEKSNYSGIVYPLLADAMLQKAGYEVPNQSQK